jgi:hypothetical protein
MPALNRYNWEIVRKHEAFPMEESYNRPTTRAVTASTQINSKGGPAPISDR